ncbi:Transposon Ty3-I Gag-Pol polyprotein [Porphyridium purpureum]|uniref:RNA-directed DNA polymerase n=1 Tax=Porphyridium purpureum TaxID=35688 RepID=A0A5J4Z2I3_PORPP|nr:Transposon Ty3-I Gag-Pol polyprotein [Porphyridium purpureum]|eukprot:POR3757..scf295_1
MQEGQAGKCETPEDPTDLLPVSLERGQVRIFDRRVLCSVRGSVDRRPFVLFYVRGTVGWIPTRALVDTGATGDSYASRAVAESWGAQMQKAKTRVDNAQGSTMGPAKEAVVLVRLGALETPLRVLVVEELAEELIVGMEFWHRHSECINLTKQCVQMRGGERIPCFTNTNKDRTFIHCAQEVVIPAFTERAVSVLLPQSGPSSARKPSSWRVRNSSRVPLKIGAGQKLASIRWERPDVIERETLEAIAEIPLNHVESASVRKEFLAVVQKHWRVFRAEAGRARSVQHVIRTEDGASFPAAKLRRRSESERVAEETMVKALLKKGILEPCSGPYASANVLVRKPTGAWRLTTDFRNLNAVTVKDKYPIPLVQECLDWAGRFSLFSTLDLTDGFFQVPLHPESRDLTAMITPLGLFRYCVIAQGMSNSPATFQRLMNTVLGDLRWKNSLIYIDDLIVGTKSKEEHLEILDQVLQRFEEEGLTFSLPKCSFLARSIEFLGHEVEGGKIRPKRRNVEAIRAWEVPANPSEVQRFLGVVGWFRAFVPGFEKIAAPLREALAGLAMSAKKSSRRQAVQCVDWSSRFGKAQREAFERLKTALCDPSVVLYQPIPGAAWMLDTDASTLGVGAALYRRLGSSFHPVCFLSRALTPAEKNYAITELECLAVVWAVRKCRHYLYGESICIRSDHEPLKWLLNLKEPRGRLARWALALSDYNFVLEYIKGPSNKVPDALSRQPLPAHEPLQSYDERMARIVTSVANSSEKARELPSKEELKAAYAEDEQIAKEIANLNSQRPEYSEPEYFCDEDGILWAQTKPLRRVVPDALVSRVLGYYHSTSASGHMDVAKTIGRVASGLWWWPGWTADVREFLQSCRFCARRKGSRQQQVPIGRRRPTRRFELVAADLLTISPKTARGFDKVLVVADLFSRFTVAVPVADETARSVADGLLSAWVAPFGPPEALLSDNGPAFRSELLARISQLLGIGKVFTLEHNPKANGVVERYNRTLCGLLAGAMADHDADVGWDVFLPLAVHAYNASWHASLGGLSPYEVMFGRPANDFSQAIVPEEQAPEQEFVAFADQLRGRIKMMHALALAASDRSHAKNFARSAASVSRTSARQLVKVGDAVMLWRGLGTLKGRKLEAPWVGPYELLALEGSRATIRSSSEEFFVHVDRIKHVDTSVELSSDFDADSARRSSVLTEISSLQKRRERDGQVEFLVAWYGAKRADWTWELAEDLPETLVREFEDSFASKGDVLRTRSGRAFR